MGKPGYTIGLVVHPTRPVRDSVEIITRFAHRHGGRVVAREADVPRLGPGVEAVAADGFVDAVDAIVSLGGDGTMLGAMRLLVGRRTPILGVNHGNLGFLVEVPPAGLTAALDRLVAGDYALEPHSCLDVAAAAATFTAFNDVVVTASERLAAAVVDLFVNDAAHGYYRGDAVVACTPIGSTAYNYAAGGPVISPSTPSIALTPVAPMSGISRSVVFGDGDAVELRNPADGDPLRFTVDGTSAESLAPGAALRLSLRPDAVHVIRFDADRHQQRNRVKLSLLDLPLRPDQLLELVPPELRDRASSIGWRSAVDAPRA